MSVLIMAVSMLNKRRVMIVVLFVQRSSIFYISLWSNYIVSIRYNNQSLIKQLAGIYLQMNKKSCNTHSHTHTHTHTHIHTHRHTQHVWEFSISQRETTLSSPLNTLTPVYNVYKLCRGM